MSVDRDVVTGRSNCASRAEIETAAAANDLRARMCTQIFAESYVTRFVKGPGEVARLQHRAQNRCSIPRIGAQIAIAEISSREKRWAARQIDKNVTAGHRTIATIPERERGARGRAGRCVIVDCNLERTEIALGGADRPLYYGKLGDA